MNDELQNVEIISADHEESTPIIYSQPVRQFSRRVLHGEDEDVDFIPETGMRIWYNNQFGNFAAHKHDVLEICIPIENEYKYIVGGKEATGTNTIRYRKYKLRLVAKR